MRASLAFAAGTLKMPRARTQFSSCRNGPKRRCQSHFPPVPTLGAARNLFQFSVCGRHGADGIVKEPRHWIFSRAHAYPHLFCDVRAASMKLLLKLRVAGKLKCTCCRSRDADASCCAVNVSGPRSGFDSSEINILLHSSQCTYIVGHCLVLFIENAAKACQGAESRIGK